jgi:hypothetical protein
MVAAISSRSGSSGAISLAAPTGGSNERLSLTLVVAATDDVDDLPFDIPDPQQLLRLRRK